MKPRTSILAIDALVGDEEQTGKMEERKREKWKEGREKNGRKEGREKDGRKEERKMDGRNIILEEMGEGGGSKEVKL